MDDRIKKGAMGVALLAAFALGGAAVAGAVQGGNSTAAATATTTQGQAPRQQPHPRGHGHHGPGGRRADETALTDETATKVRAAAVAKVPGATVERLETDADGNAAYEAHMTKADRSRVTVYVDRQFEVVKVEEGR